MADFASLQSNSFVSCPFDRAHVMKYSKFHNHFVKCQKNHPNDKRLSCPYNYSELIDPEKLENHKLVCPFRIHYQNRNPRENENAIIASTFKAPKKDVKFGDDVEPQHTYRRRVHCDFVDETEIDSITVVGEKARNTEICETDYSSSVADADFSSNASTESSSIELKTSIATPPHSEPLMPLGKGRGALFRNLTQKRSQFQNDEEFSFICSENVKPSAIVTDNDKDSANFSCTRSSSKIVAFTKAALDRPDLDDFLAKRLTGKGRGRGLLFQL